ncbi:MAG: hypothetical protein ACFFD8_09630 [Candidatus Thorarchaeota archaeon]
MKVWLARCVLVSGLYDIFMAIIFLFGSPILSIAINYPITPLSGALLQIIGGFLIGFGLALITSAQNLDQLLIVPLANIPARLIALIILVYYIFALGLPYLLLIFGIIDGAFAILFAIFIIAIPEYDFRLALGKRSA